MKYTIYWLTKNRDYKRQIKDHFHIQGETVNGESEVHISDHHEEEMLHECARRGFLQIRDK